MDVWNARNLQIVWFPNHTAGMKANALLETLTGSAALSYEERHAPSPREPFLSAANGQHDGLSFRTQIGPSRVDLIVSAQEQEDGEGLGAEEFSAAEALDYILGRISNFSPEVIGDVGRLSIISNLAKPFENYLSAASHVFKFCGMEIDSSGFTDINFQANKRLNIEHGMMINRLFRFAIAAQRVFAFEIDQASGAQISNQPIGTEKISLLLQMDFNTVPDGKTIIPADQYSIFKRITDETLKFAEAKSIMALV